MKQRLRMLAATALDRALRLTGLKAGVAIIYHGIRAESGANGSHMPHEVAPSFSATTLREQLEYFNEHYRLVLSSDLREAALERRRGEPFPVAVTFDDDLRSHLDLALPLLRGTGAPATFFLTGASLHGPASFWWERIERAFETDLTAKMLRDADPRQAVETFSALPSGQRQALSTTLLERLGGEREDTGLRVEHVAALASAGCEVGFHTRAHEWLPDMTDEDLAQAMHDGVAELEEAAGMRLRCVAYPHGGADARVATAARAAGFECGFTTQGAAVRDDTDPLLMGRLYPSQASLAHLASQVGLAIWKAARGT